MVNVGILGLGPAWQTRYRSALEELRERIRLRAVYDPVFNLAEQAALDDHASAVPGILALLEQPDVQAILVLDTAWYGQQVLELLCRCDKPIYLAGYLGEDVAGLRRCHEQAVARGLTLMPEFSRRYTPATGRLQELTATELGPPHHLAIEAHGPRLDHVDMFSGGSSARELLVGLFDWCRYILRTPPVSLQARFPECESDADGSRCSLVVEFGPQRSGGAPPRAELQLSNRGADRTTIAESRPADCSPADRPEEASETSEPPVCYEIRCERGTASIRSPVEISWTTGSEVRTESLKSERSETEVMLDHFCRRVVGGLIPVADLADRCRSLLLTQAAEESLRTGRKVWLNGQA